MRDESDRRVSYGHNDVIFKRESIHRQIHRPKGFFTSSTVINLHINALSHTSTITTMNLFLLSASVLGAEAFAPATNPGRLPSALHNYARSKWSPGSPVPSTGLSHFSPAASAGASTANTSAPRSYARTKWSPNSPAPTSNGFSSYSPAAGGASTSMTSSSVPYDAIRAELKSMMGASAAAISACHSTLSDTLARG